ncbi:MAG: sulfatase [Saprospiraceae bacterium]|nr:sulfatase [Saprospiraceae bacterium]
MKTTIVILTFIATISIWGFKAKENRSTRPNVLFICVDDLRPDLHCYGNALIHSPNLDALASQGTLFTRHFATQPTCGASRYSLLTGKLPRTKDQITNAAIELNLSNKSKTAIPESFVDYLKRSGYYTVGIGKISHSADGYVYDYSAPKSNKLEMPFSWDEMLFNPGKWGTGWNAFFGYADGSNRQSRNSMVKPFEHEEVNDEDYPDGLSAELAIQKLNDLAKKDQPFFLGVGFFKPHLPFNAPKKYWDLYSESDISLTNAPDLPFDVHPASLIGSNEFNRYKLGLEKASLQHPLSDEYAKTVRHAYYASISYVDAQIGKVLDELRRLQLDKNTIVVVWGDHGWNLGDHRVWGKHTLSETSLRSTLIIKTPNLSGGIVQNAVVSSIDIYPTLMDLCNLKRIDGNDGKSLRKLLLKSKNGKWDNIAYSYFNKGVTVRTDRYRLTKYFREETPVVELYDHDKDPYENTNIAAQSKNIIKDLSPILEKGDTKIFSTRPD